MRYAIGLSIIFISACFVIIVELLRKKGKLKKVDTYSYKEVIKVFLIANCIILIICIFIYFFSRSIGVAIGLGAFMLACSVASCIRILLDQRHIKQSGGKNRDKEKSRRKALQSGPK